MRRIGLGLLKGHTRKSEARGTPVVASSAQWTIPNQPPPPIQSTKAY